MSPHWLLAHGAAGPLDEVAVVVGPLVLLALLLRSRPPVDAPRAEQDAPLGAEEEW